MYFRIFLNRNETIVVTQNLKLNLLFLYRALFLRVFVFVAKSTMVESQLHNSNFCATSSARHSKIKVNG